MSGMRIALAVLMGSLLLVAPEPAIYFTSSLTVTSPTADGILSTRSHTIEVTVSELGSRTAVSSANEFDLILLMPAASGDIVVAGMPPKTFWRIASKDLADTAADLRPQIEMKPTGQSRTIVGVVSEQYSFASRWTPTDDSEILSLLPPGVAGLTVTGSVWLPRQLATDYERFAKAMANADPMLKLSGLGRSLGGRFPTAVRYELGRAVVELEVTSIRLAEAAPQMFAVPAGFKEVPAPFKVRWLSDDGGPWAALRW